MGKKIGLVTATLIGMASMIGAGIFVVPAALATSAGPVGLVTFLFVIISVWFIAQCFARLVELFPQEGAFYNYAKSWGGHIMGIVSTSAYIIGLVMAMGLLNEAQQRADELYKDLYEDRDDYTPQYELFW